MTTLLLFGLAAAALLGAVHWIAFRVADRRARAHPLLRDHRADPELFRFSFAVWLMLAVALFVALA